MQDTGRSLSSTRPGAGMVDFSRVFPKDTNVYLRYDSGGKTVNVAVTCQETFDKTNVLSLAWPEANEQAPGSPPPLNSRVKCVAMLRGRLIQFPAKVCGLHQDQHVTLMLALDPHCRIVNMRRHERYRVFGWVHLGGDAQAKSPETRQQLDLSLGGFGATVSESELESGQEVEFLLHADVYSSEEHSQEYPPLEIRGNAILRRLGTDDESQQTRIGAEFCDLPAESFEQLKEWLTTNISRLCTV